MYEAYWRLKGKPFESRFDDSFYYPSESHQAALLKLRYSLENGRSVAALCGPSGIGKSLVLHQLKQQLPEFVNRVISISYSALTPEQLVTYIAFQLDPEFNPGSQAMPTAIRTIEHSLKKNQEQGGKTLIIIDEAEWLDSYGSLETLRLVLNLATIESTGESAAVILLCGQPVLIGQLARHIPLDQRVAVRCTLNRFTVEESHSYIDHRMRVVSQGTDSVFTTDAVDGIHALCDGIPRRINTLCDLALMVGYAQELTSVSSSLIENVHRELNPAAMP